MPGRGTLPTLYDIVQAIERIRTEMTGVTLEAFEADWRKRWLVERGVETQGGGRRRPSGRQHTYLGAVIAFLF